MNVLAAHDVLKIISLIKDFKNTFIIGIIENEWLVFERSPNHFHFLRLQGSLPAFINVLWKYANLVCLA